MEEYTYTNQSVIERMNGNYVPVKVNIQSFDGFDLKNQYKVTVLPTIIVLDSKGRQVARYEESMSASKLSEVLDKHNLPQNRSRIVTMANSYSSGFTTQTNNPTTRDSPARSLFVPSPPPTPAPVHSPINNYNNAPARKTDAPDPVGKPSSEVGEKRAIPTNGFTIQAGAYGQLANAQQVVAETRAKAGNQKQYIMQSKANGKTTYRIFIGSFPSRQEADAFRRKAALEGYVRSFGDFAKKGWFLSLLDFKNKDAKTLMGFSVFFIYCTFNPNLQMSEVLCSADFLLNIMFNDNFHPLSILRQKHNKKYFFLCEKYILI